LHITGLGVMKYHDGEYEKSLSHLKKSAEINPQHAESNFFIAMILRSDEDASLAKKHFYKALELNPEYSLGIFRIG